MRYYDLKGQAMGQGPFAARKSDSQSGANRRRSTRIDYETAVILSGRDAAGQTYRDETITEIVNIHGARVRTDRKVLVGMLVSIECMKTGRGSKAVCVNVYVPSPEEPHAAIAIQLLKPGNIWGFENPPSDWGTVAAALGGGISPADSSWSGVASSQPVSAPKVRPYLAEPELAVRAEKMIEESLARLRNEIRFMHRNALADFDEKLGERMPEVEARIQQLAEARIQQLVEEAATEVAATIQALKSNLVAELVQTAVDETRARLEELSKEDEVRTTRRTA